LLSQQLLPGQLLSVEQVPVPPQALVVTTPPLPILSLVHLLPNIAFLFVKLHVYNTPFTPHTPSLLHVSSQSLLDVQHAPVGPSPFLSPEYPAMHVQVAFAVVVAEGVTLEDLVVIVHVYDAPLTPHTPSLLHVSSQSLLDVQHAPVGPSPFLSPEYPAMHVQVAFAVVVVAERVTLEDLVVVAEGVTLEELFVVLDCMVEPIIVEVKLNSCKL